MSVPGHFIRYYTVNEFVLIDNATKTQKQCCKLDERCFEYDFAACMAAKYNK